MASEHLKSLQTSLWSILATLDTKECSVRELYGLVIRALRDSMVVPEIVAQPAQPTVTKDIERQERDGKSLHQALKEHMDKTSVIIKPSEEPKAAAKPRQARAPKAVAPPPKDAPPPKTDAEVDAEVDAQFEKDWAKAEKSVKDKAANVAPAPPVPKARKRRTGALVSAKMTDEQLERMLSVPQPHTVRDRSKEPPQSHLLRPSHALPDDGPRLVFGGESGAVEAEITLV